MLDGREAEAAKSSSGFFIGPTIFDFVKPSMDIYLDEIFGPVLSVVRVDSLADAIGLINDHNLETGLRFLRMTAATLASFKKK